MEFFRQLLSWRMHVRPLSHIEEVVRSFTASGRVLFIIFAALIVGSSATLLFLVTRQFLVTIPAPGGSLNEGIIGAPRFINPLLAISDADRDLVSLTYSGLLRQHGGDFVPDLAESYEISDDGRTYTFTIKPDATFQDGTPVTADDIVYTVTEAQDPNVKSPKRANWDGVLVEKVSDREVRFTLKSPYAPFIENATLGVLPKHLWKDVTAEEFPFSSLNVEPVGSGPYRVTSVDRNAAGIPQTYTLAPFRAYALGRPYLSKITLTFYENEQQLLAALKSGAVEAASGISPSHLKDLSEDSVRRAPLNRVFGVFFNQNQSELLRDKTVRTALSMAVNRQKVVDEVLGGFGTPIDEPLPPGIIGGTRVNEAATEGTSTDPALAARSFLEKAGWTYSDAEHALVKTDKNKKVTQILAFTLSTANVPEMRASAEEVRAAWERMGARVDVKIFEQGDLNQNVIRPRKYDALLFGEIVGRELDLFAFWHSSQRNDPGLNIALYANSTADHLLEQLRVAQTDEDRESIYRRFLSEEDKDVPAVFLYSPDFTYVLPKDIQGLNLTSVATPSERFLDVYEWHTEVDHVWSFLTRFAR
jgi:peptide/nickel transport system substrate-binding protein